MGKSRNPGHDALHKSSTAAHRSRDPSGAPAKPAYAPTTRALDHEGRIADLQAKIRDLETQQGRIERIHQSWVALFDAIRDPIFMHDRQGRILRANRAYADTAGLDVKDAIGRFYWEVFPRREGPQAGCARVVSGPDTIGEEELTLEGGQTFLCRFFAITDPVSGYAASVHLMQDITERQRAETALRRERDFTSAILDTSGGLVAVLDRTGRIVRFNQACETITGYRQEEMIGAFVWDSLILPEEADGVKAVFAGLVAGQFPNRHQNYWRTKDGRQRLIMWSDTVLLDDGGNVEHVIATGIDVTERRAAEDALRASEARFRSLIENSSDITSIIGAQGSVQYISPSITRLLGYEPEELLGRSAFDFIHPDDRQQVAHALQAALENPGVMQSAEFRFRDKDGAWHFLQSLGKNVRDDPSIGGVVVNSRDVTARVRTEESLRRLNRALRTLSAANASLIHAMDESELLSAICQVITDTGGYRFAWVGYAEQDDGKAVRPVARAGYEEGYLQTLNLTWADEERGRGPTGTAIRTNAPYIVRNIPTDPAFAPWRAEAIKHGYASCISLPLSDGARTFAALGIYAAEPDAFDVDEVKLLTELANDLSFGIVTLRTRAARAQVEAENAHNLERLRRSLVGTIEAVAATVEARDPYTAGHEKRVAQLAVTIAREMGLPETRLEGIRFGSLIHDLGKIQVPAEILSYPGRLNKIQLEFIKMHAEAGYEILKGVEFPWPVAEMALQHHERLDGSGYPRGLKGEEIILEARILAVADVVEAMSSHRPYRPGLGIEKALAEIGGKRGVSYDAGVVDACLRLFRERGFTFEA